MQDRLTHSNVVATIAVVCGLALIGWAGVASASAAQQRLWNVMGSLTGTYTSDVTWVNCLETGVTGTAREQLRLDATLAGGKPALYQLGSGMVVTGKWRAGGSWSVTGSNPPRQEQANGDVTCGAQRPFHCGGPIRGGGGGSATIHFAPRGRCWDTSSPTTSLARVMTHARRSGPRSTATDRSSASRERTSSPTRSWRTPSSRAA
jgi:hypothetical protein